MPEIDRSRILAYQRCPRERYIAYHHKGKGLQRVAKGLPLQFGSAFHEGAEELLKGDVEKAVARATDYLKTAFAAKGVALEGEGSSDASMLYSAQEQIALVEALLRGWGLERLPEFLQTFEILDIESEGRAALSPSITLMFRPDALVRDKLSGDVYVISWKTTSAYGKKTLQSIKVDMQSMSEVFGLQQQHREIAGHQSPLNIEGVLYLFAVKGSRRLDDFDNQWKQDSRLIYAWKKLKPVDEFDDQWSWTFRYPKEEGGNSTLGKGWKKVSVWDNFPGGTKAWIEALHRREIFPRHVDPFDSIFPQPQPIERRKDEIERWRTQIVHQEVTIDSHLRMLGVDSDPDDMERYFPQYSHSCSSYNGCSFMDVCWNGVPAEPGELYQIRQSNHPEGEEED